LYLILANNPCSVHVLKRLYLMNGVCTYVR
jgi:hypothetical protein